MDFSHKDQDKDLQCKNQGKDKDFSHKDQHKDLDLAVKDKDLSCNDQDKDLQCKNQDKDKDFSCNGKTRILVSITRQGLWSLTLFNRENVYQSYVS